MENQTEVQNVPGYKETIQAIGRHLGERKGLILKRTLLVAWPAIAFVVGLSVFKELMDAKLVSDNSPYMIPVAIGGGVWLLFSIFYYFVFNYIFTIEKRVWIDSFFDKRELTPQQSWRIARRLFFPGVLLSLQVFVRYILPGFIVPVIVFAGSVRFADFIVTLPENTRMVTVLMTVTSIIGVGVIAYFYWVAVTLRFLPFIFLDRYGTAQFSYAGLFQEMKRLNAVRKTAVKSLVYGFGENTINGLVSLITGQLQSAMGSFGPVGRVLGTFVGVTTKEVSKQALSYGKIIAFYMLYQYARSQVHATTQEVNEEVYKLAE